MTSPDDVHAQAVALSLRQREIGVLLWYTSDFPTQGTESILFKGAAERMQLSGVSQGDIAGQGISRVWRRRPA
ncbi:MAG: hypothetical protein ACREMY_00245, partial [bacterium]